MFLISIPRKQTLKNILKGFVYLTNQLIKFIIMRNILILIIVLFVYSCSSGDDMTNTSANDNDNGNATVLRLTKFEEFDSDGVLDETITLLYDEQNRIAKLTDVDNDGFTNVTLYNYISNMLTSTEWIKNGTTTITDFTYENGLIILATVNEPNYTSTNEYSYNSLNQLISKKQFDQGVFCCEDTFTYNAQGNISSFSSSSDTSVNFFDYDNKNNLGLLLFDSSYLKIREIGNNNIIKSYSDSSSQTVTYTYQYNDDNYPTISKMFVDGVLLREVKYTYELFTN